MDGNLFCWPCSRFSMPVAAQAVLRRGININLLKIKQKINGMQIDSLGEGICFFSCCLVL